MTRRWVWAGVLLALSAGAAQAHTGTDGTAGLGHGFGHPFSGLDHILAMVAVGVFAANLGGRPVWLVPASFVSMMAVGGMLGIAGVAVPFVEIGIALSVIALGTAVALRWNVPVVAAMALVGFFAIFHGHAHGSEMPADVSGLAYAIGFTLATAILHAIGIGLGLGIGTIARNYSQRIAQVGGGAMALAGVGLLAGWL